MRLNTSRIVRPLVASLVGAMLLSCLAIAYQSSLRRGDSLLAEEPTSKAESQNYSNWAGRVRNPISLSGPKRGEGREQQAVDRIGRPTFGDQDEDFDRQARQLAKQYKSATAAERTKLLQSLKQINERHFEYRQTQRQNEIENLSERIDVLRGIQLHRQQNKDEVLRRRLNALIDPNTELEWDGPASDKNDNFKKGASANLEDSMDAVVPGTTLADPESVEPVFNRKPLSEWLKVLATERSLPLLFEALVALKHLARDADSRVVGRAIFRMSQSLTSLSDRDGNDLGHVSLDVLHALPSEIVIDELIVQLDEATSRNLSPAFKFLTTTFIGSINDLPDRESIYFNRFYESVYQGTEFAFAGFLTESTQSMRPEIRRRSRRLISALVNIAKRDPMQSDWVVETSHYILDLSEEPLSTYKDLIPVVELVFASSQYSSAKGPAAVMLAESGMQKSEAIAYLKFALKHKDIAQNGFVCFNSIFWCVKLGPSVPEAVDLMVEQLAILWAEKEKDPMSLDMRLLTLMRNLGGIGAAAKSAIPMLQTIERSPIAKNPSYDRFQVEGPNGQRFKARGNLSFDAAEAIKEIEEAVAHPVERPKPEPLADDESPKDVPTKEPMGPPNANVGSPITPVTTFDGILYSQWLKMLETERKPEKLATAMDACARLAEAQDERRIAGGIFLATRLFESGSASERDGVWNAGWNALNRLSPESVTDELLVVLRDQSNYKNRRGFLGRFVAEKRSLKFNAIFKVRSDKLIDGLLKAIGQNENDRDDLIAAASSVWSASGRPLDDFPPLKTLMLNLLERDPVDHSVSIWYEGLTRPWRVVASNLVQQAPDTPDLALQLMKSARKSFRVVELIGKLGKRAEPIVPDLVDYFVEEWNKWRSEIRDEALKTGKSSYKARSRDAMQLDFHRRRQIIQTLGQIGAGEKANALLHQLNLISLPKGSRGSFEGDLFSTARQSLQQLSNIPNSKTLPVVLNDDSMITGHWRLRTRAPVVDVHAHQFLTIGDVYSSWYDNNARNISSSIPGMLSASVYTLDESKNPKQLSLVEIERSFAAAAPNSPNFDPSSWMRQEGIYELTETKLRIQISKIGESRPTQFVEDKSQLPPGQFLLELERQILE